MSNIVRWRGNNSGRRHSHSLWYDCPMERLNEMEGGHYKFDDFLAVGNHTEADDVGQDFPAPYYSAASDGVTIDQLADSDHGILRVAGTDADEDGAVLVYGNAAGFARFGPTDKVWAEARLTQGSVADSNAVSAFGLIEVNAPPTSVITQVDATGVIDASEDFVGFRSLQADGDVSEPAYQLGGQTLVHVGSGTANAAGSGNDVTLAAATFQKFGVRWDGPKMLLEYFVDGARVAYYQVPGSSTTFPFTNHLALIWAVKTTAAAEVTFDNDWWSVGALTL